MRDDTLTLRSARALRGLLLAFLGLTSFVAHGQAVCYQWQTNGSFNSTTYTGARAWFDNTTDPGQELLAWCNANKGPSGFCNVACGNGSTVQNFAMEGPYHNSFPTQVFIDIRMTGCSNGFTTVRNMQLVQRTNPAGCPVCQATGTTRVIGWNAGTGNICVEGCAYSAPPNPLVVTAAGASHPLREARSQGRACSSQTGTANAEETEDTSNCMNVSGIGYVCAEADSDVVQVGTNNVENSDTPENGCMGFSNGAVACDSDAPSPPAPNNGTPGTPATPNVTITVDGRTTNYYNSTVVGGSTTPPVTTNPNDGNPEGDDDEEGSGTVTGGLTCESEPVCDGDALQCAIIAQEWRARCPDELLPADIAEILGPGTDIDGDGAVEENEGFPGSSDDPIDVMDSFSDGGWLSSRSCPSSYSVSLPSAWGGNISYSLTDACWFFNAIGAIVLVLGYFMAGMIVVKGF